MHIVCVVYNVCVHAVVQGYSNPQEAMLVVSTTLTLARRAAPGSKIMIITFYNAQRRKLEALLQLRQRTTDALQHVSVTVCSIDGCQVISTYIKLCFTER
jgi:AAA domain